MPRHYTDEEKRLVLDRLIANHGDVARTADETGINRRTLYLWIDNPKFTDQAQEITQVKLKNVKNFVQNDPSGSPSPFMERGLGGEVLPPDTTEAFQQLHDQLLPIARILADRITEAIDDAPLNQRVAALAQLIDRIAKLAALLPKPEEEEDDPDDIPFEIDYDVEPKEDADDQEDEEEKETGSASATAAYLSEENSRKYSPF